MVSRANGEALQVETSNLHFELRGALKEDVSRKKTDEMKKRAIHTAASYDEFRHMVSCAHLTPVTRKEMEMLSDQKRGWQGRSGGVVSATKKESKCGLRKTRRSGRISSGVTTDVQGTKTEPLCPPVDRSGFQREWRQRCRSDGEKRQYLRLIGPENLPVLFRVEMEPDILSQVLSFVCRDFTTSPGQRSVLSSEERDLFDRRLGPSDGEDSPCEAAAANCAEWLWALTKTGRFAINMLFLEDREKLALRNVFKLMSASLGDGSEENARKLEDVRQAYAV